MTQDYYGTKRVTAWPQVKEGAFGYAVKYADGYVSWSPKEVFEETYKPLDRLKFSHVLEALTSRPGRVKATRKLWNTAEIFLQTPDEFSKMNRAYLYSEHGNPEIGFRRTPWYPDSDDLLADDWELIEHPSISREGTTHIATLRKGTTAEEAAKIVRKAVNSAIDASIDETMNAVNAAVKKHNERNT